MHAFAKRLAVFAMVGVLVFPATLAQAQSGPSFRSPTADELTKTRAGDQNWVTYGGSLFNQRYSTLDQINTSNVKGLKGAWLTRLGSGRGTKYYFEADPIVIDGVLYIPTGNDDIFALDGKTGRKLWEYDSDIPQTNDLICCGWDNRGVAAGEGKIFSGQLDGSFVALDQKTGQVAWRTQLEDYHDGYSITGATRYYDGIVLTGMSGAENGVRGRVYGLDAKTGKELWRFWTIPGPNESAATPGRGADRRLRAGVDSRRRHDLAGPRGRSRPGHGLLQHGQRGPRLRRLRCALATTCSPRRSSRSTTGPAQYKWHFQEDHHEIWDFDAPSPTVLFDTTVNGQARKGMYQCGKTGCCYFLDRTNGQPLIGIDEKPVRRSRACPRLPPSRCPLATRSSKHCPEPLPQFPLSGCIQTDSGTVLLRSTGSGGNNWSPTSYACRTATCTSRRARRLIRRRASFQDYERGKKYVAVANVTPATRPTYTSTYTAIDSRTNKIVWQKPRSVEPRATASVTHRGRLCSVGRIDGNLMAHDAGTGEQLWSFQTGWGISAPPMTYSDRRNPVRRGRCGRQSRRSRPPDGDAVWAFALNGTIDEVAAPPPIQTKTSIGGALVHLGEPIGRVVTVGQDVPFDGTVRLEDYFFLPTRAGVPVGTTLNFQNNGSVVHTATDNGLKWDTGNIAPGESVPITFDTAGTYTFTCTPHPWMLGQVVVQ